MSSVGGASSPVPEAGTLTDALRARIEKVMLKGEARLDLDYSAIGCHELGYAGVVFVAEALRGDAIVKELWLTTGAPGAFALAEALSEQNNTTLRYLCLHDSESLGDDGAQALARMLRKNTTLRELFLGSCGVGARGALALAESLKATTTLETIVLDMNNIGDDGAAAFAEVLRCNESLKFIGLSECGLSSDAVLSLVAAMRDSNSTLTYLNLTHNIAFEDSEIGFFPQDSEVYELIRENEAVVPATAERRARCLLFCCLQLAPSAHEHVVPSIGAVPVPVMKYAVEHAGKLHVAKRFEVGDVVAGQSSAGVRSRSTLE